MRLSTRWNILLLTVLPITIIYVVIFGLTVVQMQKRARKVVEGQMTELAGHYASQFDGNLRETARIAESTATFLETHPGMTEDQIYAQLRANVSQHELVYGAALAFEPKSFDDRELVCPYVFRDAEGLEQIDIGWESYDYTEPEWEWWNAPREAGNSVWTEPYFDEGAGSILMCTYSVPFEREGKFWGVTTIDIPLDRLNEKVDIEHMRDLDFFIVTRTGQFVFHPDSKRIMKDTIFEVADHLNHPDLAFLGSRMTCGQTGVVRMSGWESDRRQWFFYAPIPSTGWGFAARISEREALADVRMQIVWIAGALTLSLVLIVASSWVVSGLIVAAQKTLREREEHLDAVVNGAIDAIVTIDQQGVVASFNKAAEGIFGYVESEVVGRNVNLLMPEPYRGEHDGYLNRYLQTGEAHIIGFGREVVGRRKTGDTFPMDLAVNEMRIDGQVMFVGFARDITHRKQAEQELRLQSTALESAANAIVITDREGTIRWVNPAFSALTQYDREEAIGATPRVLKSDHHPPEFYKDMWETVISGKIWLGELVNRRKDGSLYYEEMTITPVRDGNGEVSHFVAIKQDITERKKAETEILRARQAAEEANRAKSAFLANMSHEIRTPMNGIMGMTDLALDTELSPEQREYLTTVKSSAESLLTLLNDILDFSKIEAGKLELDPIDFGLRNGLGDTLNTLAVRAHAKHIELAYHVLPDVPDRLNGDIHRLRQIIVNLVGNAIKFTEKGEVVVRTSLELRADDHVDLHFSVSDTGTGIPADKLEAIFSPFEQADTSTTRRFGGTGLGLAISTQLVALMEGRIWVKSELGQGSRFHFTARFKVAKAIPREYVEAKLEDIRDLSILIVDDNRTNRRILEEMAKNWGMNPTSVEDGSKALRALDQARNSDKPFDLVVSDVNMPGMSGFELAASVKQSPLHAGMPIILLTSASRTGDAERCRTLGVAAHLMKPVKQSSLLDAIVVGVGGGKAEERPAAGQPDGELPAQEVRSLRVLLAEDNPVNQKFAVRTLEKTGHSVVVANNGREAVDAWGKEQFDLVLMDVQMPEMDGFEATASIRGGEKGTEKYTPIIAMTAHAMKGDRERCLDAGMDGYVTKPVKASTLFAEVERVLAETQRPVE